MPLDAKLLNLIFFVTKGSVNLGRVFFPNRSFQPSLMLLGEARTLLKLKGALIEWA
jgi:hypothetical protein